MLSMLLCASATHEKELLSVVGFLSGVRGLGHCVCTERRGREKGKPGQFRAVWHAGRQLTIGVLRERVFSWSALLLAAVLWRVHSICPGQPG